MLFGTSGIRGDAETFFTEQFCFDIGRSFAIFLKNHDKIGSIAIGMDPRESSQRIKDNIIEGLLFESRYILDEGISPSPAMNYILVIDPNIDGSVMITGSHIRGDFNGIKLFFDMTEILKAHEKEIEDIYFDIKDKVNCKDVKIDPRNRVILENRANKFYQDMLYNLMEKPYPRWKIVLDLGNGCQSKIMPGLFKRLSNINAIIINDNPKSEYFIARDTEVEDSVRQLQETVRKECADLGVAFDGDGDRVVFVDENGEFIPGDYSGSLIAKYSDTGFVITPVNVSQIVEKIGKNVIRTKVGSPYVVKAMLENNATFGFEANGGGISKEIMLSRDAGSAMIKVLNILNRYDKTLKLLIAEFPKFFIFREKIDCPMKIYPIILETVRKEYTGMKIDDIDGLKIWKDENTWILFRPSLNAPEFRVFAEANLKENAKKLCDEGIEFVTRIRDNSL